MPIDIFPALEKAIEAGGSNLTARQITGSGRNAAAILEELCSSGFLRRSGERTFKYTVTPEGRAAWEREVKEREEEEERLTLVEFLKLVENRVGKALTQVQQRRFGTELRQDACQRRLVEAEKRANAYRLLPAGEAMLRAEPIKQDIKEARKLQREMINRCRVAQGRLQEDLILLNGQGAEALRIASTQLDGHVRQAGAAFEGVVAELGAFSSLLIAARDFKAAVEGASGEALRQLHSSVTQLAELEQRLSQAVEQQREQIQVLERRMGCRIEELARRLDARDPTPNPSTRPSETPAVSTDLRVWDVTRQAAEQLRQETLRLGGIVKVPELTDAVRKLLPDLTASAFHDLLGKWQQEGRLTLQVCNDPRLEPRRAEGIESPRGLLFYVYIRE